MPPDGPALLLEEKPAMVRGFSGLLIPPSVSHVLRVCLIADLPYRIERAKEAEGLSENEALERIRSEDADRAAWTETLFSVSDPGTRRSTTWCFP